MITNYRAHPALSQSDVKNWMTMSPKEWKARSENKKVTDSMIFGQAVHNYLLEPKLFHDRFVVEDWPQYFEKSEDERIRMELEKGTDPSSTKCKRKSPIRRGKVFEAWKAEFQSKIKDKEIIPMTTGGSIDLGYQKVLKVSKYLKENFDSLFSEQNQFELSLFGQREGVDVKGQLDIYRPEMGIIDLKFTGKDIVTEKDLNKLFFDGRWDIQAKMYIDLVKQNYGCEVPFLFLVVNHKKEEIQVRKILVDPQVEQCRELLDKAGHEIDRVLLEIRDSTEKNSFPDLSDVVHIPTRPRWL